MRGKINRYAGIKRLLYGFIISAAAFMVFSENAAAITVNDTIFAGNPYISLSPDGNAFTVGYGDKSMAYHGNEYMGHTRVMFGDLSGGPLSKGQHYFSIGNNFCSLLHKTAGLMYKLCLTIGATGVLG